MKSEEDLKVCSCKLLVFCLNLILFLFMACFFVGTMLGTTLGQLVLVHGSGDGAFHKTWHQVRLRGQGGKTLWDDPQEATLDVLEGE